jgi:hypothetical protein
MAIAYNTSIVRDGLVRYVDFSNPKSYPGSGSTLFDLTNTFNNTISGGTVGTYDNVLSIDFDGTYGSTGRIDGGTTSVTDSSFTVDVWFRSTDDDRSNGVQGRVIASTYDYQGSATTQDTGWYLGTVWVGTYFRFEIYNGTGTGANADLPSGFYTNYLNTWTNVVGVFSSGNFVKIYQDGELKSNVSTAITTLGDQNDQLVWARRSAEGQSNWKGQFSSGKYYNRALIDAEVKKNFDALRGRYGL